MFQKGNIIYFTPFYFRNGNPPKNKYFLVLATFESDSIIVSLPSSKDYIPQQEERESGCIELPEANLNSYVISPSEIVTECGKSFKLTTYLYGHLLDDYKVSNLGSIYKDENKDYEVWGIMREELLNQIIECFRNYSSVKNKYKRRL